ncbi:hypothetical protein [Rhizobium metallidurans]|uniref:Uncharacterized protein n=1 Tax=Rhizobium metallidurans TaxID=1265931 RepID=A0A7W6GBJ0_9HYPH|nr:hypothetical protein [Rhizobium metallidurans]MBB3965035.1 hypothetical protein [Rhizobium metallidurans]
MPANAWEWKRRPAPFMILLARRISTHRDLQFDAPPVYIEIQRLTGRIARPTDVDSMHGASGIHATSAQKQSAGIQTALTIGERSASLEQRLT